MEPISTASGALRLFSAFKTDKGVRVLLATLRREAEQEVQDAANARMHEIEGYQPAHFNGRVDFPTADSARLQRAIGLVKLQFGTDIAALCDEILAAMGRFMALRAEIISQQDTALALAIYPRFLDARLAVEALKSDLRSLVTDQVSLPAFGGTSLKKFFDRVWSFLQMRAFPG